MSDSTEQPVTDSDTTLFTVLGLLRQREVTTRPELVEATGLGRKIVTQRVDDLIRAGLAAEGPVALSTGGRPASQVSFLPGAGHVLVAELGSTSLTAGVADLAGTLLATTQEPTAYLRGPEVVLDRLEQCWDALLAGLPVARVRGACVGVIGPVAPGSGVTMDLRVPSGWAGYPIGDRLTQRYSAPTWVDNDVNLMAVGEHRGRGGSGDLVFVKVDAGIGAGLISAGRLHHGATGVAGEIGHLRVTDDPTVVCWCGNTGCLAEIASSRALAKAVHRHLQVPGPASDLQYEDPRIAWLLAGAAAGDRFAGALLERAGEAIGRALAGVVNVFNPAAVVIGGSLPVAGEMLLTPLRRALQQTAFPPTIDPLTVSVSLQGDRAGLVGAASMAIENLLSPAFAHHWLTEQSAGVDRRAES